MQSRDRALHYTTVVHRAVNKRIDMLWLRIGIMKLHYSFSCTVAYTMATKFVKLYITLSNSENSQKNYSEHLLVLGLFGFIICRVLKVHSLFLKVCTKISSSSSRKADNGGHL